MTQPFSTVNVLGYDFIRATQQEFVDQLKKDSDEHANRFVVTANPEIVLTALNDPKYSDVIKGSDYLTADGIGIVKGAAILGESLPERVTGYDTMCAILKWADKAHKSVYFLGARPEVISTMIEKIRSDYPGLRIAGYHDGYFKDDTEIVSEIAASGPDFVFCALGFPKQEYFIARNRRAADAIWMGIGGSFDVLAGYAERAPQWWIDHHIEWLYRLVKEPSRFIRMLALPKYLLLVLKSRLTGRR